MGYLYIFLTVILTVYGQVILKWRLNQTAALPELFLDKIFFLIRSLFDPYIFSSFFSAFLASLAWMAALKEFELSKAYPFMSLSFVCVLIISFWLFKETVSVEKVIGSVLIIVGVLLLSKSA
jgi:multidrug transporter EmrE-like cation transporter